MSFSPLCKTCTWVLSSDCLVTFGYLHFKFLYGPLRQCDCSRVMKFRETVIQNQFLLLNVSTLTCTGSNPLHGS